MLEKESGQARTSIIIVDGMELCPVITLRWYVLGTFAQNPVVKGGGAGLSDRHSRPVPGTWVVLSKVRSLTAEASGSTWSGS